MCQASFRLWKQWVIRNAWPQPSGASCRPWLMAEMQDGPSAPLGPLPGPPVFCFDSSADDPPAFIPGCFFPGLQSHLQPISPPCIAFTLFPSFSHPGLYSVSDSFLASSWAHAKEVTFPSWEPFSKCHALILNDFESNLRSSCHFSNVCLVSQT